MPSLSIRSCGTTILYLDFSLNDEKYFFMIWFFILYRSKLSSVKENYKNDIKLAYLWPVLLIRKLKDVKAKKEE